MSVINETLASIKEDKELWEQVRDEVKKEIARCEALLQSHGVSRAVISTSFFERLLITEESEREAVLDEYVRFIKGFCG